MIKNIKLFLYSSLIFVCFFSNSVFADRSHIVKKNESLERIVKKAYPNSDLNREQLMVAVLYENNKAFRGGNIHYLNRGKKLNLPNENQLAVFTPSQANKIIKTHTRYYRKGKTGNLKLPEPEGVAKLDPNELQERQVKQLQNLNEIQKETDALKQRLDKLIAEKQASDQKLESLEQELNKTR